MKKSEGIQKLSLVAAISLLSAGAFADTPIADISKNIQVYGVIDYGVTYDSNEGGSSKITEQDSVNWGNRIGFKGAFDLAPGYQAIFQLEHGFHLSDGETSQYDVFFGRQAFAGIKSDDYGTVTFGRQYDFMYDNLNQLNIGGYASTYGGHHGDLDRISGWRINNAIKYVSPTMKGFKFGAMYASKDDAYAYQDKSDGESMSAGASYAGKGWSLAAAYVNIKDTTVYPYLQLGIPEIFGETLDGSGVEVDQEVIGLGGSYQFGKFTFIANTTQTTLKQVSDGQKSTQHVYEVGGLYPVADKTIAIGGYQHSKMEGYDFDQITVGLSHDINQYASVYTSYSYEVGSDGTYVDQGAAWYGTNSSTNKQQTARVGVILKF